MVIEESINTKNEPCVSIFDVSEVSSKDGPGIRTVVFFQGCKFDCTWCHSPHSRYSRSPLLFFEQLCSMCMRCQAACERNVHIFADGGHIVKRELCCQCGKCIDACPNSSVYLESSALKFPTTTITAQSLFSQLLPQMSLCGGVTLSGGEALLQDEALTFLRLCKDNKIHTCVETSGLLESDYYKNAGPFVDVWLFGTRVLTNNNNDFNTDKLIENARVLRSVSKSDIIPVIPLIPGVMNREDSLNEILKALGAINSNEIMFNIWNRSYNVYYNALGIKPEFPMPLDAEIERCEKEMRAFFTIKGYKIIN